MFMPVLPALEAIGCCCWAGKELEADAGAELAVPLAAGGASRLEALPLPSLLTTLICEGNILLFSVLCTDFIEVLGKRRVLL